MLLGNKWIRLPQAIAYQYDTNNTITNVPWTANYTPDNNNGIVGFTFGNYNRYKPLVLLIGAPPMGGEPVQSEGLCWSTFLGGNYADQLFATELEDDGELFVTGITSSEFFTYGNGLGSNILNDPYPLTALATLNKFSPQHELLWTSYLGGNDWYTYPWAISVDRNAGPSPNVYIGGRPTPIRTIRSQTSRV